MKNPLKKIKQKNRKFYIIGLLVVVGLIFYFFVYSSPESMVEIGKMVGADGKVIKSYSVVGGVEGVKYITLKVNVENKDKVTLSLVLKSITPSTLQSALPTNKLSLEAGKSGSWETGLIDVEQFEGKTQPFCITVLSEKLASLREESSMSGCLNITVLPNPTGSFVVGVSSGSTQGSGVNPGCTESWTCSEWSTCSSGTQTRSCVDSNNCGTTNGKPSITQTCVSQVVKFRTNLDSTYPTGSWVAYDSNQDGALECFTRSVTGSITGTPIVSFTDVYGKSWLINSATELRLVESQTSTAYSFRRFTSGTGCELSLSPVPAYSGKEVYS